MTSVYFDDEEKEFKEALSENIHLADMALEEILQQELSELDQLHPDQRTTAKYPYENQAGLELAQMDSGLSMARVTKQVMKHGAVILQKKYGDARKRIRESKKKLLQGGDIFIDTNLMEGHLHPPNGRQIRKGPYIIWWVNGLMSELAADLHVQKMTLINVGIAESLLTWSGLPPKRRVELEGLVTKFDEAVQKILFWYPKLADSATDE